METPKSNDAIEKQNILSSNQRKGMEYGETINETELSSLLLPEKSAPRSTYQRASNKQQSFLLGSTDKPKEKRIEQPNIQKKSGIETIVGRHVTVLPQVEIEEGEMLLSDKEQPRYDSLGKLGEGGAGEVLLVKDNDIFRKVAMKRIKEEVRNDVQMARFIEEVKTIGQLDHPNIIPIHDVGIDEDGQHFFTMKYVQGETLEEIIEKLQDGNPEYHKTYSYERRAQIFIEILHAVRFAHERGIIHRDLKPANIMVGEYGEVMVMDWGIAKRIRPNPFEKKEEKESNDTAAFLEQMQTQEELQKPEREDNQRVFQTQYGAIVGTPAYMAPEQVLGEQEKINERSDIYSLTILFYEFLNLVHPFAHKNGLPALLLSVVDEDPLDSERIKNPHQGPVPRELCFFLRKGAQKNPNERFADIKSMTEELQANLEGRTCVYCPSTFLKRGSNMYGHYLDNHRIFGVVVFVLLLGILGFGMWQMIAIALKFIGLV